MVALIDMAHTVCQEVDMFCILTTHILQRHPFDKACQQNAQLLAYQVLNAWLVPYALQFYILYSIHHYISNYIYIVMYCPLYSVILLKASRHNAGTIMMWQTMLGRVVLRTLPAFRGVSAWQRECKHGTSMSPFAQQDPQKPIG